VPDPRPTPIPDSLERANVPRSRGRGDGRQRSLGPAPGAGAHEGHGAGEVALVDTVYGALSLGMKVLTVYAFSTENWVRPIDEVRYLMNFNQGLLQRRQDELHADGVRIVFSGRRDWRCPVGA